MVGSRLLGFLAAMSVATAISASAQTWVEQGDAGDLVSTSQQTIGNGPLQHIVGTLDSFDTVDMYCINITDKTLFLAQLQSTDIGGAPLWLFDPNSIGITSQEGFYINSPSTITGLYVLNPGTYYLAVSLHDVFAQDPGGFDIWSTAPRSVEIPPDGQGAPGPLASWRGSWTGGAYDIVLRGTGYCGDSTPTDQTTWGRVKTLYR
jgi:hypothetical protein